MEVAILKHSQRKLLFLCLEAVFITITLHMFYITPIVDFTYQCDNKIIAKEKMWLKGADIILIPEIPYNVDEVLNTIRKREKQGKKFTIIAMAEGAISDEAAGKTKMVNVDNELIRQAESLGISLGRKA